MMNTKMMQVRERVWQRPLSLFLLSALALGAAGWVVAYAIFSAQAAWVLMQAVWRLTPLYVWLAMGATAVFWLWLLRRLWR